MLHRFGTVQSYIDPGSLDARPIADTFHFGQTFQIGLVMTDSIDQAVLTEETFFIV